MVWWVGECRSGGTGLAPGQVPQCKSCLTPGKSPDFGASSAFSLKEGHAVS